MMPDIDKSSGAPEMVAYLIADVEIVDGVGYEEYDEGCRPR